MKYLICSIIKNEHRYLAEWIEHHLSLGFTDIYLFEDFGSDNHKEITDKYPQVHLNTCDNYFTIKRDYDLGWARQIRLYQKFLNEHHIDGWCAFIDIDEYIFLNNGYTLDLLTQEYSNETGIALFWKLFNANNRIHRVDKVVESYTQSCNLVAQDIGWGFKSFVNLLSAKEFKDQHLIKGLVDTNRNYIVHRYSLPSVYDKIQLNHYFTKSYEDWCDRFFRGDLAPNHRKWEAFFEQNPTMKNIAHYKHELNRKKYKDFKSDDLISVVMCTYNRAKFLDNVISNILNQTYTNLEFVIVDDGSTDNSKEILEEWKKKDSRIRVIYSDHNFCKSRNLSFKEAKGAYVACMDSDDECALDRLEKQYLYLKAHQDVDIVGTLTSGFVKTIANIERHQDIINNWKPSRNELVVFGTLLIKKSILDKFKSDFFFSVFNAGGEDTVFKLCALNYGAVFANLQETLYYYNNDVQSMSTVANWKGYAFDYLMRSSESLEEVLQTVSKIQKSGSELKRLQIIQSCKHKIIQNVLNADIKYNKLEPICISPISDELCAYTIGKCGCTTLCSISAEYYKNNPINSLPYHPYCGNHNYFDSADKIDRKVVLVYRDPILRWKSFYNNKFVTDDLSIISETLKKTLKKDLTIDDVLYATQYSIQNLDKSEMDSHIRPISDHIFIEPDYVVDIKDLPKFLEAHGIQYSIENSSGNYDVPLTTELEQLLKNLYANDYNLLNKYKLWKPSNK